MRDPDETGLGVISCQENSQQSSPDTIGVFTSAKPVDNIDPATIYRDFSRRESAAGKASKRGSRSLSDYGDRSEASGESRPFF